LHLLVPILIKALLRLISDASALLIELFRRAWVLALLLILKHL
jgi:hypothetical protein